MVRGERQSASSKPNQCSSCGSCVTSGMDSSRLGFCQTNSLCRSCESLNQRISVVSHKMGPFQRALHKLGPVELFLQDVTTPRAWRQGATKFAKMIPCLAGRRTIGRSRSQHHRSKVCEPVQHARRSEDAVAHTTSLNAHQVDDSAQVTDDLSPGVCEIRLWSSTSSIALSAIHEDDDDVEEMFASNLPVLGAQCFDMSALDSDIEEDLQDVDHEGDAKPKASVCFLDATACAPLARTARSKCAHWPPLTCIAWIVGPAHSLRNGSQDSQCFVPEGCAVGLHVISSHWTASLSLRKCTNPMVKQHQSGSLLESDYCW